MAQFTVKLTAISRRKGKDLTFLADDIWQALRIMGGWKAARAGGTPTMLGAQTVTGYNDQGELLCAFIRDIEFETEGGFRTF